MGNQKGKIPRLTRHAPSGRGRVRLSGHDHYFGVWPDGQAEPPPGVKAEYDALVARWLAGGRKPLEEPRSRREVPAGTFPATPAGPTVAELALRYLEHADAYYRGEDGRPTGEVKNLESAFRPLVHLFGRSAAADFGPRALRELQRLLVAGYEHPRHGPQPGLSRNVVNAKVKRVRRLFRWGAGEELVPASAWHGLSAVEPLKRGRTDAPETEPVPAVPEEVVFATLPFLAPSAAAVVRLMWYTGCRPGEAVRCRLADIDRSGEVWAWRPRQHKNRWRGHSRSVSVWANGQAAILEHVAIRCPYCGVEDRPPRIGCRDGATCGPCADWLDEQGIEGPHRRKEVTPADVPIFSPARDRAELFEDRRAARKSKVQPSQRCRKKARPRKVPGPAYDSQSLGRAVRTAAERAGVPSWSPNEIRHSYATRARALFGVEHAAAALGHAGLDTVEVYAQRRSGLSDEVARRLG